jgi:D-alanine-D-alanine ligase-like ATP-grasp enzyme
MVELRAADIGSLPPGSLLLRLSDPVMLLAAQALGRASIPYFGPSAAALARCYDKWEAYRLASEAGIDCPATALANEAGVLPFPLILKPRQGSDSIGVRLVSKGPIPVWARTDRYIAQERIVGAELTIAVIGGRAGMPLRLALREGTIYSFWRKYLARPRRTPIANTALSDRVRALALRIAGVLAIDWAARIDLMHEPASDRVRFLECDVAPLVGPSSAFTTSLAAAGVNRAEQLRLLAGAG